MAFNFSRYNRRSIFRNSDTEYYTQLSNRDVPYIDQYSSATFTYPTDEQLGNLFIEKEYWGVGARFYKMAAKYYGDPSLWWIIPWFNKKPLESDFKAGDLVMIPLPLNAVMEFFA